jgi:hypothetical protein
MLMSDILKVVAAKLGLNTQSSIWSAHPFDKLAYIPEKFNQPESSGNVFNLFGYGSTSGFGSKGYTSPDASKQRGYPNSSGGDALRLLKLMCNGKFVIQDGTSQLELERRDYFPSNAPFKFPAIRQDWNGYNTDELVGAIKLTFLSDMNDKNCIDHTSPSGDRFYTGTVIEIMHEQIAVNNQKLVLMKGLRDITIPVARGVNKDSLTFVEQLIKDIELIWDAVVIAAVAVVNILIAALIVTVLLINVIIAIWNLILALLTIIVDTINTIISIATVGLVDDLLPFNGNEARLSYLTLPSFISASNLTARNFTDRYNALLVENDILSTPKIVMIDTSHPAWANRIGYLHPDNAKVVNAEYLWNNFYLIDAFVDNNDPTKTLNRYTKIDPATNRSSDKNPVVLSLANFKNLVSNPKFLDQFSEEVIADSIRWSIYRGQTAEFDFRKAGWLLNPHHPDVIKRHQEIAINIRTKTSLPNGQ